MIKLSGRIVLEGDEIQVHVSRWMARNDIEFLILTSDESDYESVSFGLCDLGHDFTNLQPLIAVLLNGDYVRYEVSSSLIPCIINHDYDGALLAV